MPDRNLVIERLIVAGLVLTIGVMIWAGVAFARAEGMFP
jgi:hypothetical protein